MLVMEREQIGTREVIGNLEIKVGELEVEVAALEDENETMQETISFKER